MLEVKVGPPQIAIHDGYAVLVTEPDGQINWPTDKGLYFRDTRLISGWCIYANGETWELLNGGSLHLPRGAHLPDQPADPDRAGRHSRARTSRW